MGRCGIDSEKTGAGAGRSGHDAQRNLELNEYHWRSDDVVAAEVDVFVGARTNGDLVLALGVDHDQRRGGGSIAAHHGGDVDSRATERVEHGCTDVVAADGPNESSACTEPSSGHGLIGALAARLRREPSAAHGFARSRKSVGSHLDVVVMLPSTVIAGSR